MSIGYKDVLFPNRDTAIRMLDDEGELTPAAKPASSGELTFARLGKASYVSPLRVAIDSFA
jgi:hypothetical protein